MVGIAGDASGKGHERASHSRRTCSARTTTAHERCAAEPAVRHDGERAGEPLVAIGRATHADRRQLQARLDRESLVDDAANTYRRIAPIQRVAYEVLLSRVV